MYRSLFCSLTAVLLVGVTATPAPAWHSRGHMTVALIAYRQLEKPDQQKVQNILKGHPHFKEFLSAKKPADASLEEWIVMQAAVWPDWVRSPANHGKELFNGEPFNQPLHHYVNLPIKRLEGASDAQKESIEKNIAALPSDKRSGLLLKELPKRLDEVSKSKDPATQAVALCWVLHLVGDIHQPLHGAALFTKGSLGGDRGGNAAFVRWNGRAENLHSIWDGVVGWDEYLGPGLPSLTEFGVVDLMTRQFRVSRPVTAEQLKVSSIDAWAEESRDLADKEAYSSKGAPLSLVFNFDQHPHLAASDVDPLPDGYPARAQAVAEGRVALAGARLAGRLKEILP
jgi:hypothetical protein